MGRIAIIEEIRMGEALRRKESSSQNNEALPFEVQCKEKEELNGQKTLGKYLNEVIKNSQQNLVKYQVERCLETQKALITKLTTFNFHVFPLIFCHEWVTDKGWIRDIAYICQISNFILLKKGFHIGFPILVTTTHLEWKGFYDFMIAYSLHLQTTYIIYWTLYLCYLIWVLL